MAGYQKQVWLAAAGIALFIGGVSAAGYRAINSIRHDVDALGTRIETASGALADIKKNTAVESTKLQLGLLDTNLKKTNDTLAQIQKSTALDSVKAELAGVNSKIESANAALNDIQKSSSLGEIKAALLSINSKIEKADSALADIQKNSSLGEIKTTLAALDAKIEKTGSTLADIQKNSSVDDIKATLASLDAKIEKTGDTLARMQKSPQPELAAAHDDTIMKLQTSVDDLTSRVDAASASLGKVADAVTKLNDVTGAQGTAKPNSEDLVVFYVTTTGATESTGTVAEAAAIPPMSVRYERIGGLNDNGQTSAIAEKVKAVLKNHKGCTIAVAGHADTLGNDRVNLAISRKRANEVVAKLKAALAGTDIAISQTAWGERQLRVWTPDQKGQRANRSVDISMTCKG